MSSSTLREDLDKTYRTAVIVGIAMIGSVVACVAIAELIRAGVIGGYEFPMSRDDFVYQAVKYALLGLSCFDLLFIKIIGSIILSGHGARSANRLMTKSIVAMAICESVAIYGLVLFLLAGSRFDLYLFTLVSLIFFGVFFPRYHRWERWLSENSVGTRLVSE